MAIRAVAVAAKTILSEEGETVITTAVRMLRTTVVEEAGVTIESTQSIIGDSITVGTTEALGKAASEGMGSKISELPTRGPREFEPSKSPAEADMPDPHRQPEFTPGRYDTKTREIDTESPNEVNYPDPKTLPEVKPGEVAEIKSAEKEVQVEKKEEELIEKMNNNVPTDPNTLGPAIEQGQRNQRPEMGENRAVTEIDRRDNQQQESTDDGKRTLDVGSGEGGPEVGRSSVEERM